MEMQNLIAQCLADSADGWAELWELVECAALKRIRDVIRRRGADMTLADEVMQALYFHLRNEQCRLLRAFAGTGEDLKGYLGTLAVSLALNFVRDHRRARKREAKALGKMQVAHQSRPDDQTLAETLKEFKAMLQASELAKLMRLLNDAASDNAEIITSAMQPISPRTRRRWEKQLHEKYLAWRDQREQKPS